MRHVSLEIHECVKQILSLMSYLLFTNLSARCPSVSTSVHRCSIFQGLCCSSIRPRPPLSTIFHDVGCHFGCQTWLADLQVKNSGWSVHRHSPTSASTQLYSNLYHVLFVSIRNYA